MHGGVCQCDIQYVQVLQVRPNKVLYCTSSRKLLGSGFQLGTVGESNAEPRPASALRRCTVALTLRPGRPFQTHLSPCAPDPSRLSKLSTSTIPDRGMRRQRANSCIQ
jgi:hypothetical protein